MFAKVVSIVAAMLAGAALAVSLLHAGPSGRHGSPGARGPAGPAGKPASAQQQRLGICWNAPTNTGLSGAGFGNAVEYVTIDQAIYDHGVYTCPQGDTFVSIVPGPTATP